jgi:uncharacterized protein (TIGR00661 family)
MKILYAIQGTGNGHISRARDIVPELMKFGQVDILISGIQAEVDLGFPVRYRFTGLSLIVGKKGGVDVVQTYRKSNLHRLLEEINSLPVEEYHLVISDFEPVSAWACFNKGKQCVGLSHQAAVANKQSPRPKKLDPLGKLVLKHYAPADVNFGFHFQQYAPDIFTPVIRQQIRQLKTSDDGHYTVYLPAYSDARLHKSLSRFDQVRWEVFSKHADTDYDWDNIAFRRIDNEAFINSLASARGVLCGAGFETPSEVLFLGKQLMVAPMRGQFEQQCNAAALKEMGIPVIKNLKKKSRARIAEWLEHGKVPAVDYPDETADIVNRIVKDYAAKALKPVQAEKVKIDGVKSMRRLTLRKMLAGRKA